MSMWTDAAQEADGRAPANRAGTLSTAVFK
jgi:hypothetical protein